MNGQEARIIDPLVTKIMLGYKPANLVYSALFPEVPVARRGGKIVQWGRDMLEITDTTRAIGADVQEESYSYGNQGYSLEEHNLDAKTPAELAQEAKEPKIELQTASLGIVKAKMGNEKEKNAGILAGNTANYSGSNSKTYVQATGWNGTGNPVEDGIEAVDVIEQSTAGLTPNIAIISRSAFKACKTNTHILAQVQYTGTAPTSANVTTQMLATLWGVDEVLVGKHSYWNGSAMVDSWGDNVIFAYSVLGSSSNLVPSFGYTYQLQGYPFVSKGWFRNKNRSFMRGYNDSYQNVIAMKDSGYLIKGAGL
jgi:hypothetical protein